MPTYPKDRSLLHELTRVIGDSLSCTNCANDSNLCRTSVWKFPKPRVIDSRRGSSRIYGRLRPFTACASPARKNCAIPKISVCHFASGPIMFRLAALLGPRPLVSRPAGPDEVLRPRWAGMKTRMHDRLECQINGRAQ